MQSVSGCSLDVIACPADVVECISSYLDGVSVVRLEQTCKTFQQMKAAPSLWKRVLLSDFMQSSARAVSLRGMAPRVMYQRRFEANARRKLEFERQLKRARADQLATVRRLHWNTCFHCVCLFPVMIVQAFLPFLWLLLMCLRVDGKIHSSDWWAIMWPGVAFFGGWTLMLGLETTFSQFACIADLYKSFFKPLVEAYSSRPRAIAALLVTTLGFASLTVWAILLPLKLNDTMTLSWVQAFIPFWIGISILSVSGIVTCSGLDFSLAFFLLVGLWALALSIPLVIRADGKSIRLELAFIPLWFIDAVILLAAIIAVVKISLEGHDDDEDRFWRKVCFIVMMLVSGLSAASPLVVTPILLVVNSYGIRLVPYASTFSLVLVVLATLGLALFSYALARVNSYRRKRRRLLRSAQQEAARGVRQSDRGMFGVGNVAFGVPTE